MKSKKKLRPFLNRYTTLPILLDMLVHKKIVLLNPSTWEDRNDAHYLERYKTEKNLKTVVALCFSKKRETFHHWKIFSGSSAGVCVEFDKAQLLRSFPSGSGFRRGDVNYHFIKEVRNARPEPSDWPFIKRKPFKDEAEYRILYESETEELAAQNVSINLGCIQKVTLSPWMPEPVAETVKQVIGQLDGCENLEVERSSLLETDDWKAAIRPKTRNLAE